MGFCTKCGSEIPEGAVFCMNCGASIDTNNNMEKAATNPNGAIERKQEKPMAPWLGIVSLVLAIIGLLAIDHWIDLVILYASIIIAIVCLIKKARWKGFPIAALVIVLIVFSLYGIDSISRANSSNYSGSRQLFETENASKVDPDLKAFLDSYEDFVDDYVAFMKKYTENPTDLSLLGDYSKFLQNYSDFASKVEKVDTSNMSTDDYNYYIEVTTRCSQKLLNVLSSE